MTAETIAKALGGRKDGKDRLPQPFKLGGKPYWPKGDLDTHLRDLREKAAAE